MIYLVMFISIWAAVWVMLALWALLTGQPVPPPIDLSALRKAPEAPPAAPTRPPEPPPGSYANNTGPVRDSSFWWGGSDIGAHDDRRS